MITKGVIVSKSKNDNKYMVRIPTFESVGNSPNLINSDSVYEASLCYMPGILDAFVPGDVVYLGFEDNDYGSIIILGKLYQGSNAEAVGIVSVEQLKVKTNTEITGKLKVNGIDLDIINEHTNAISTLINSQSSTLEDNDFGDWIIKQKRGGLVLNFYRKGI